MNSFATIDRVYPFNGGSYASKKQPSTTARSMGFKPTFIDASNNLVQGDTVEVAELNYIFNDLYEQAANIDRILTAKGK
ncbi:TPA: hypothetical protein R6W19_003036 [Citrobacter braakii]|nr:hypothetical protein [Citrobacter braakii]HEE9916477.1 hypothetical protein [Citrobacter braakii]